MWKLELSGAPEEDQGHGETCKRIMQEVSDEGSLKMLRRRSTFVHFVAFRRNVG